MKWLLPVLMLMLSACAGEFDMFTNGEETETGWGSPSPVTNPDGTPVDPNDPNVETTPLRPGFEVERNEVRLLPFHTRVQKLSMVTGLSSEDPLFDQLWSSRYDLGDHNFGQGIGPDLSWNASKMATWVRALQPICASEQMAQMYALPGDTGALMSVAYGRTPDTEEVTEFTEAIAAQNLDEAAVYQATCLAVLTSSEFVAQ